MASHTEHGRDGFPDSEANLESPFLREELFGGEADVAQHARLETLEAESPFRALEDRHAPAFPAEAFGAETVESTHEYDTPPENLPADAFVLDKDGKDYFDTFPQLGDLSIQRATVLTPSHFEHLMDQLLASSRNNFVIDAHGDPSGLSMPLSDGTAMSPTKTSLFMLRGIEHIQALMRLTQESNTIWERASGTDLDRWQQIVNLMHSKTWQTMIGSGWPTQTPRVSDVAAAKTLVQSLLTALVNALFPGRSAGRQAHVDTLIKKMLQLQAKGIREIQFRSCNIGKDPVTLYEFRKFLSADHLCAPDVRSGIGRVVPRIDRGAVDRLAKRPSTQVYDLPGGRFAIFINIVAAKFTAACAADSQAAVGEWVTSHVMAHSRFRRGTLPVHFLKTQPLAFALDPDYAAHIQCRSSLWEGAVRAHELEEEEAHEGVEETEARPEETFELAFRDVADESEAEDESDAQRAWALALEQEAAEQEAAALGDRPFSEAWTGESTGYGGGEAAYDSPAFERDTGGGSTAVDPFPRHSYVLADLPQQVQQSFAKGPSFWQEAVKTAIGAGVKEARKLADIVFFMQHPERMKAGVGRLIDPKDDDFVKTRAEWILYFTIVSKILDPKYVPTVFVPERKASKYEDFVAAPMTGRMTLMVNGRKSDGSGKFDKGRWIGGFKDAVGTFDRMQETVESLGKGDWLYIASWQFHPLRVPLTIQRSGIGDWGQLLVNKAKEGVKIRVLIAKHPPGSEFETNLNEVDGVIKRLSPAERDNFKYIMSAHPNSLGVHHRKFVVARKGKSTVAFCGGLDIAGVRTPGLDINPNWHPKFVWHDVAAKLEGAITHDLEREFVEHWNHERTKSAADPLEGWKAYEKLSSNDARSDGGASVNGHKIQMVRTVSLGPTPAEFRRDDIWRAYFRLIGRATRYLYFENQYFHEPKLADAIVKQAESQPDLIVMVIAGTGSDDRQKVDPTADFITRKKQQAMVDAVQNMLALRLEFFERLLAGIPEKRVRVYTLNYEGGITHTKLVMVDDEALTVGSANANPRGFFFDTEVNVILEDPPTVKDFRQQLWAHNLGLAPDAVAKWGVPEFFKNWDALAAANGKLQKTPVKLLGEGIIPFHPKDPKDPRFRKGARIPFLGIGQIPPEVLF